MKNNEPTIESLTEEIKILQNKNNELFTEKGKIENLLAFTKNQNDKKLEIIRELRDKNSDLQDKINILFKVIDKISERY